MLPGSSNRRWVKSSRAAFVLFTILLVLPSLCLSDASIENNQLTAEFSTLLKQLKTTSIADERNTFCENALSSGLLRHEELGMVYGMKGANYFEMAMQRFQNMKDTANWNRDIEMQAEFLLRASLQHYNTAIAIIPGLYLNYWNRGYIYELMAKLDKAVDDYTKALELSPDFVKAYLYRARVLMEQGKRQQATEDVERALTLDPENKKAKATKQRLLKYPGN